MKAPRDSLRSLRAEEAYLFRHALLRDAAYQLQMPGDRAKLHALTLEAIELLAGGRAPEPLPGERGEGVFKPHSTDPFAWELAEHARQAEQGSRGEAPAMLALWKLYLRRSAEVSEVGFRNDKCQRMWLELAELVPEAEKGVVLQRAGAVALRAGRPGDAEPLFQRALELHRRLGQGLLEGVALGSLAGLHMGIGRMEQAERMIGMALAMHRKFADRRTEGKTTGNLAVLCNGSGRHERAQQCYEEALAIHREVGNRRSKGIALGNLAAFFLEVGRVEQAERGYLQALAIHSEVGNRRSEGIILGNLASLYGASGRIEQAERSYEQALAIDREVGNRRSEGIALGNFANFFHDTGRDQQALQLFRQALVIHREVGNRLTEGVHLCNQSWTQMLLGDVPGARASWRTGAEILRALGDSNELAHRVREMRRACAEAGVPPFDDASP